MKAAARKAPVAKATPAAKTAPPQGRDQGSRPLRPALTGRRAGRSMSPADPWEEHAEWWQDKFTDGADAEYEEQILPLVEEYLAGARVLDVGTGEGQVARRLVAGGAALGGRRSIRRWASSGPRSPAGGGVHLRPGRRRGAARFATASVRRGRRVPRVRAHPESRGAASREIARVLGPAAASSAS